MPCVAVSRCSLIWPCRGSILHPSSSTSDAARYCPMPAHRTGVPFQSTCALYGLPMYTSLEDRPSRPRSQTGTQSSLEPP